MFFPCFFSSFPRFPTCCFIKKREHGRRHGGVFPFADAFGRVALDYLSSYFLTMTVALWPPKPKEFDRAARTGRFWARSNVKLRV